MHSVLAAKVGVSSSGLNLENSILNCEKGHVESSATHVINENIALTSTFSKRVQSATNCSPL